MDNGNIIRDRSYSYNHKKINNNDDNKNNDKKAECKWNEKGT